MKCPCVALRAGEIKQIRRLPEACFSHWTREQLELAEAREQIPDGTVTAFAVWHWNRAEDVRRAAVATVTAIALAQRRRKEK